MNPIEEAKRLRRIELIAKMAATIYAKDTGLYCDDEKRAVEVAETILRIVERRTR